MNYSIRNLSIKNILGLIALVTLSFGVFAENKESDSFNVKIFFTRDIRFSAKFLSKPEQPNLKFDDTFKTKEKFEIVLLFGRFKVNKAKEAKIEYSIKILDPSNKTYFEKKDLNFLAEKLPQEDVILVDPNFFVTGSFEESDLKGKYTVIVEAKDSLSNVKVIATNTLNHS